MNESESQKKLVEAILAEDARLQERSTDQELLDSIIGKLETTENVASFWKTPFVIPSIAACAIIGLAIVGLSSIKRTEQTISKAPSKKGFGPFKVNLEEADQLASNDQRVSSAVISEPQIEIVDVVSSIALEDSYLRFPPQGGKTVENSEGIAVDLISLPSVRENKGSELAFKSPLKELHSTFPIETDRASYTNLRNNINNGVAISPDSIRIEELINAFEYDYGQPKGEYPFAVHVETAACPWNDQNRLIKIGLKGKEIHTRSATQLAKDVKISVEFNPIEVQEYRLLGYSNRILDAEGFKKNSRVTGEIEAGHAVTAFYEVVLGTIPVIEELNYASPTLLKSVNEIKNPRKEEPNDGTKLLTLKLGFKYPEGTKGQLFEQVVVDSQTTFENASKDFQFASAVALYGLLLRNAEYLGSADVALVEEIATKATNDIPERKEFINLVQKSR